MATNDGARRRSQKYPDELRERAVRMVQEVRRETGEHGTEHAAVPVPDAVGCDSGDDESGLPPDCRSDHTEMATRPITLW